MNPLAWLGGIWSKVSEPLRVHKAFENAVESGDVDTARAMLDRGANANAEWYDGYRPLEVAASVGPDEMVCLLVRRGARVNVPAPWGVTAIMMSAYQGYRAAVRCLIEHGADIHARDEKGRTVLSYACCCRDRSARKELLADLRPLNIVDRYAGQLPIAYLSGTQSYATETWGDTLGTKTWSAILGTDPRLMRLTQALQEACLFLPSFNAQSVAVTALVHPGKVEAVEVKDMSSLPNLMTVCRDSAIEVEVINPADDGW